MASQYVNIPAYGAPSWRPPVPSAIDLPAFGNTIGDAIVAEDTSIIYVWNGTMWVAEAGAPGVTALNGLTGALSLVGGSGITITPSGSTITIAAPGEGSVTSVGLADGSTTPIYSISGSPVTTAGTLIFSLTAQSANMVFAGPASGAPTQPSFRSLVAADIPALGYVTSVALADSTGLFNITGSPITSSGTLTLSSFKSQSANTFLATPDGSAGAPTFRAIAAADVPTLNQNTTGTASNVTGVVAVANGGTNATTVAGARTSLGIDAGAQFITSGTTYTTPANITAATQFKFTAVGGGGGGGGFSAAGSSSSGGGGGGGGILFITGLSPSTAYTIAIGAAGTAGPAGTPGAGGAGGNTTLTIGATTYTAAGGGGSPGGASNVNGGAGGTATNFTINIKGRNGNGGADNSPTSSGQGGDAPFGLGLGGAALGASGAGLVGTGYGGGGGGAHGTAAAGGAGTAGAILVEWSN